MAQDWLLLANQWERLRWARLNRTPFERAKDAAESLNIKPGTYRTYEYGPEDNGREPPLSELQRICRKFGVNWIWVATGEGSPDFDPVKNQHINELAQFEADVPEEDRERAWRAALGAFNAFRKAG